MPFPWEYARGLTQKRRDMDSPQITMYKDDPGRYFDALGAEVDTETAEIAGFDVQRLSVERRKRAAIASAQAEADGQAAAELAKIDAEYAAAAETTDWTVYDGEGVNRVTRRNVDKLPRETERLTMDHKGAGKWNVIDKADGSVIATKVPEEDAMNILKKGVT